MTRPAPDDFYWLPPGPFRSVLEDLAKGLLEIETHLPELAEHLRTYTLVDVKREAFMYAPPPGIKWITE